MANKVDIRAMRKKLGMNQEKFWAAIGVTQSGGCRYETGRDMPAPTQTLFDLVYGNTPLKALAKLRGVSIDVLKAGK